jgi:hypothetical protein
MNQSEVLCIKNISRVRHQWLMPVILTIQEAEIRRIEVGSQPEQIIRETLSRKYPSHKGLVKWLSRKLIR